MRSPVLSSLLKPYRFRILGVAGLALLAAVVESAQLALFFPVFDGLLKGSAQGPLGGLARIVRSLAPPGKELLAAVGLVLAATALKFFAALARDFRLASVTGAVQHDLKGRLMELYAGSSYPYFLDRKHGQLIYTVTIAATKVATLVQKAAQFSTEVSRILAIGILLLAAAPGPTLVLAGIAGIYLGITRWISRQVSYHTGRGRVIAGAEQASVLNEFLSGIRQIMAFGVQPFWLGRFERHSREFTGLYVKDSRWLSIPKAALDFFIVFVLFGGLLLVLGFRPDRVAGQLPALALFAMAFFRLLPSLTQVGQLRMEVVGLMGEAEAVHGTLAHPMPRPAGGSRPSSALKKEIRLQRLGFSYPGRGKVLEDLDLVFLKGMTTAVVGPSGGGKSTLAYLLLGLLEPTEGRILVDGADLRELDLESWRKRIGFVSQDLFVFHGTVAENISFGRTGFDPGRIRGAAEAAHAHEFIAQLPQGYDTVVGERGMKLSGGQQQRLAIARAILHEPEVLIFDEATSFLDTESERLVQDAIERISRASTVILIAHRLSTVQNADSVIVLENGRVVQQGPPAELLRSGRGRYYELFTAGSGAPADGGNR